MQDRAKMSNKNESEISNYQSYDYEKEFWTSNREYENLSESNTIKHLIKKIKKPVHTIMDAGCGFGRLFDTYQEFGNQFILLDYSKDMLDSAKKRIKNSQVEYVEGNLYDTQLNDKISDLIISIRTTHHLPDLDRLFKELHRISKRNGYLIIECPNKKHIKNIFKYYLGKQKNNPFDESALKLSDSFYNYNPKKFENLIKRYFNIIDSKSGSFFRISILKKWIPTRVLTSIEKPLQLLLSRFYLTPSQIYLCEKSENASMQAPGDNT